MRVVSDYLTEYFYGVVANYAEPLGNPRSFIF